MRLTEAQIRNAKPGLRPARQSGEGEKGKRSPSKVQEETTGASTGLYRGHYTIKERRSPGLRVGALGVAAFRSRFNAEEEMIRQEFQELKQATIR